MFVQAVLAFDTLEADTEVQWLLGRGVGGAGWDGRCELGSSQLVPEVLPPPQVSLPFGGRPSSSCPCLAVVTELFEEEAKPVAGLDPAGGFYSVREWWGVEVAEHVSCQ